MTMSRSRYSIIFEMSLIAILWLALVMSAIAFLWLALMA